MSESDLTRSGLRVPGGPLWFLSVSGAVLVFLQAIPAPRVRRVGLVLAVVLLLTWWLRVALAGDEKNSDALAPPPERA
jgi:hypothetical protein